MIRLCLSALLALAFVGSSFQNDAPKELSELADRIPGLADHLPGVNTTNMPTVEDANKLIREKCIKVSGEKAYDDFNAAKDKLEVCLKAQVNVTELQQEMEDAKPTGDLDTVFAKYCRKTPVFLGCVKNFTNTLKLCLEEKEKSNADMIMNITESMVEFVCYKDGDRIAMFVAEGGLECITEKQEGVQNCVNTTLGKRVPAEVPTMNNLPSLIIEKEHCDDFTKLQDCVVKELEKCNEPTPANIVESLFRFIEKMTPCADSKTLSAKNSAKTAVLGSISLLVASVNFLFW